MQQKLQLICPEITGSELRLCVPLQLVLVKKLERKRGEKWNTWLKKKKKTGKIWFQTLRISMPVLSFFFSGHGKEQRDCFELECTCRML